MHPSLEPYMKLVEEGYLGKSELDNLILFNYTEHCTFDRHWNEYTLRSRGTIYNADTGEVVARAFDKFFNFQEHESPVVPKLPLHLPYYAMEKMDGSLGIIFKHSGNWRVATRGSFYSDQAVWATNMLNSGRFNLKEMFNNATCLVEIIYPENRILVNYGAKESLTLLAIRENETGEYLPLDYLNDMAVSVGFDRPKFYKHSLEELHELAKTITWQEEGWVVVFSDGSRVKVKGEDYCRIARVKSCLSPLSIWESMTAGKIQEYLEAIPEEIRKDAESIFGRLSHDEISLLQRTEEYAKKLEVDTPVDPARYKEAALNIKQKAPSWAQGYLFQRMRGKKDTAYILKLIRPDSNEYVNLEKFL